MTNYTVLRGDSGELFFDAIRSCDRDKIVVVSDPPFNIGYKYNTYKDNKSDDEYYEIAKKRIEAAATQPRQQELLGVK